ncbi:hypothetical protein CBU02nite_39130 [Clostridium butyricum]|uniref:Helix-turn-helix domain-containing protein n=1 Tax=Clostridium butyricum TaxID=1492 RepID=A0A512TT06_CLOBU|nr:helix-turn-helix domain-containing protein [Clostridium butyricum]NOW25238.1 hypothetical protein [Clostridium butyricum]GEQ23407.1 hypothetical protein CBU02nite_39130 [Clostridium butyricum]
MDKNNNYTNSELHKKLIKEYESYIEYCIKNLSESFFVIYCNLGELLSDISNDSLKLYLYLGFNLNEKGFLKKDETVICKDICLKQNKLKKCLNELKNKHFIDINEDDGTIYFNNKYCYYGTQLKELFKTRKTCKDAMAFFIILKKFMDYFNCLSSGAIKLYTYFGIYMDKKKGAFFRDLDTIADDLNVSKRSISKWFKELEIIGIIKRQQLTLNKSSYTYMIPLIDMENESTCNVPNLENQTFNPWLLEPSNYKSEENQEYNQGF